MTLNWLGKLPSKSKVSSLIPKSCSPHAKVSFGKILAPSVGEKNIINDCMILCMNEQMWFVVWKCFECSVTGLKYYIIYYGSTFAAFYKYNSLKENPPSILPSSSSCAWILCHFWKGVLHIVAIYMDTYHMVLPDSVSGVRLCILLFCLCGFVWK